QLTARYFRLTTEGLHPSRDGFCACSRRAVRRRALPTGGPRVHEIDLRVRRRATKRIYPGTSHLAVAQVEADQFFQVPELRQARVGDAASVKIQLLQMRHPGNRVRRGVGDSRAQQVQLSQRGQFTQPRQSGVCDLRAAEVKLLQLRETAQIF